MEKMFDLRLFRKANGITQLAVAEYLGVTKQMITQVETGKTALPTDKLKRILDNPDWSITEYYKLVDTLEELRSGGKERKVEVVVAGEGDALLRVPLLPIFAQAVHLRNLRTLCNFALDDELTTFYPFRKFRIETEETTKKALTIEQVRTYATADIHYRNDGMHRDVFMLMIYFRGINVSDLAELTWKDLKDGRIQYRRNKTGKLYDIKVEPEAMEIIERWKGEEHLLSVFDRYRTPSQYDRRLGDALKRIKDTEGKAIEPDCSSNWARHTWATFGAELDLPEATITLGMGHKRAGHRVTDIYIRRNRDKVDAANRAIIDYIWGKTDVPHLTTQDGQHNRI